MLIFLLDHDLDNRYNIRAFFNVRNVTKTEYSILCKSNKNELGEIRMNPEIRELNRIICKKCNEKAYENCRDCKVFQLINKIAAG